MNASGTYSLMVHGGAGALDNVRDDKIAVRYLEGIRHVLEHGREVLELGGSALQTVEACASLLEDDPVFNTGCGSVWHGMPASDRVWPVTTPPTGRTTQVSC